MISFVWSDPLPIYSGRGGSESFTIGHVRELLKRGFDARIITVGLGERDGRQFFPDIPFLSIKSLKELEPLDETIVFVSRPGNIKTRNKAYVILHTPPVVANLKPVNPKFILDKHIIVNSRFSRKIWADYLKISPLRIRIVYPFADPEFSKVVRKPHGIDEVKVLFAGRLTIEKGIYTFLEALHHRLLKKGFYFSVTTAGNQTKDGKILDKFIRTHPWIHVVEATHTTGQTAQMFADHDIVVMPSVHTYWHEAFGMISVEAQHTGTRVVASRDGGLMETDCGGLMLFEPGNSYALASTIKKAAKAGPITAKQRSSLVRHFTLGESVDSLIRIIAPGRSAKKTKI